MAQPEHARPEHTKPRFTGPQFTGTNPASLRCGTYDNGDNIDLAGKLINEDKELFGAQLEKFKRKPHILGMKIRGLRKYSSIVLNAQTLTIHDLRESLQKL